MSSLVPNLIRFGRLLHDAGVDIPAGGMLEVVRALPLVDIGRRDDFYFTLRALLIHRVEDISRFDQAFRGFWRAPHGARTQLDLRALGEERRFGKPRVEEHSLAADSGSSESQSAEPSETVEIRTFSARESLRQKDFAKLTADELQQATAMLAELRWEPGLRHSRRWRPGAGREIDLRRVLRAALRNAGEPVALHRRARRLKRRPLVLLCDISGSMERYTRMLLQFIHSVQDRFERVEAFLFATRLTRITLQMRDRRADGALSKLSSHVPDWSGGTRIGDALRAFHIDWGRRVLSRHPVVLLISDGWDRGDPALLAREIVRLRRSCHRLIWLNPLLGSPSYEPLTRGMQAALPYVDDFLPVHNLASLESLAEHLNALPAKPRRMLA